MGTEYGLRGKKHKGAGSREDLPQRQGLNLRLGGQTE